MYHIHKILKRIKVGELLNDSHFVECFDNHFHNTPTIVRFLFDVFGFDDELLIYFNSIIEQIEIGYRFSELFDLDMTVLTFVLCLIKTKNGREIEFNMEIIQYLHNITNVNVIDYFNAIFDQYVQLLGCNITTFTLEYYNMKMWRTQFIACQTSKEFVQVYNDYKLSRIK